MYDDVPHIGLITNACKIILLNPTYKDLAPLNDLIQYAMLAMPKIIAGYDETQGVEFSTYAFRAVITNVKRELDYNEREFAITSTEFPKIRFIAQVAQEGEGESMEELLSSAPLDEATKHELSILHSSLLPSLYLMTQEDYEKTVDGDSWASIYGPFCQVKHSSEDMGNYEMVDEQDFSESFLRAVQAALTPFQYEVWYRMNYLGATQADVARIMNRYPAQISDALKTIQRKLQSDGRIKELYELIRD